MYGLSTGLVGYTMYYKVSHKGRTHTDCWWPEVSHLACSQYLGHLMVTFHTARSNLAGKVAFNAAHFYYHCFSSIIIYYYFVSSHLPPRLALLLPTTTLRVQHQGSVTREARLRLQQNALVQ